MKKLAGILFLFASLQVAGQKYSITDMPGRTGAKKIIIPTSNKQLPLTVSKLNILDANPEFKRPPRQFVPFEMVDSLTRRPLDPDKLIDLPGPRRGQRVQQATVRQVLEETNAMEKELCLRGHSLRDDDPFQGLKVVFRYDRLAPAITATKGNRVITRNNPLNYKYKATGISQKDLNNLNNARKSIEAIANAPKAYWAFSNIFIAPMGEFGNFMHELYTPETVLECTPSSDQCIIIAMPKDSLRNLTSYTIDVFSGADNIPLFRKFIPLASIVKQISYSDIEKMQAVSNIFYDRRTSAPPPAGWYFLRINTKDLNLQSKLGQPTKAGKKYYFSIKLKKEMRIRIDQRVGLTQESVVAEQIVVNYSCRPPLTIDKNTSLVKSPVDFRKTDPSGKFGLYLNTTGFKTKYTSTFTSDDNCNLINAKGARVEADLSLGAVTYNFQNLINSSAPSTKDEALFSAKLSAVTGTQTGDNGEDETNGAYLKIYTVKDGETIIPLPSVNGNVPLNYTAALDDYNVQLFNERFFIGPVPCQVTIDLNNKIGTEVTGMVDNSNNTISGTFRPYASSTISGTGKVDAVLLYAGVTVAVNLIDIGVQHNFNASVNTASDRTMEIGAFGGNVTFNAGFYYPCAKTFWTGKFCNKNFAIEIFRWDGAKETKPF